MKQLGKIIIVLVGIAALLFPPYRVFDGLHWGFIFGDMIKVKGIGGAVKVYDHIDYKILIVEIAVIVIIGYFMMKSKSKKKRKRR